MNPQAHIVASETTRRLLSENGAQRLKQSLEQVRARLEESNSSEAGARMPPKCAGSQTKRPGSENILPR